jgi:hypothetical protein
MGLRRHIDARLPPPPRQTGQSAFWLEARPARSTGRIVGREDVDKCSRPGFPGFEVVRA